MTVGRVEYVVIVLIVLLVVSGVVPWYFKVDRALSRSSEFLRHLKAFLAQTRHPDQGARNWLLQHQAQMQADAGLVGKGVVVATPPAAAGGGPPQVIHIYEQLFQSSAAMFFGVTNGVIHDQAQATVGALRAARRIALRNIFNPWAWLRLSFEEIVGFPAYVLRTAGFTDRSTAAGARVFGIVFTAAVGLATIGGFLIAGGWWSPHGK